ncbi:uncharacterized protein LOC134669385 [Cydia fagiglandana]|uniref:uncharacterized protein LOC134669385 n=1 Tax=Cydia fagiglandana TaxID=1458189 RepID=UPI002FEDF40B
MAIYSTLNDSMCSNKAYNLVPNPLTTKSSIGSGSANANYKRCKSKKKSLYISNNHIHLRSHTDEKTENKFLSSFQLAAKLYKSNSDEFKTEKKMSKKSNKKSVLTLPNDPAVLPQSCTVSDMNDSEYFRRIHKSKAQKTKKRQPWKKNPKPPDYNCEYYDRDADYCSQMNLYLDCSSVDVVKNFKGDCRRKARDSYKSYNGETEATAPCASDVWSVLRNINRFQFYPSPPMSEDSSNEIKPRKKVVKKKLNRSVYETCRTEQIYFQTEVNIPRDTSLSESSQITVIDKNDELNKFCKKVEIRSFKQNVPLVTPRIKKQEPPKTNNRKCRISHLKSRTKKNSPSKDTLADHKSKLSEVALKPFQTLNRGDGSFEESQTKHICTTVEMQTGTEIDNNDDDKPQINSNACVHNANSNTGAKSDIEDNKPQIIPSACVHNNTVSNTGTMSGDIPKQIMNSRLDMKEPLQRPLRSPWTSTQPRPNIPPGRPLTHDSFKPNLNILGPPDGLRFYKLQDSRRVRCQATANPMHPLTRTAIRTILAKIKFPLVILGKDQVSGTFEVEHYDNQFRGLDEHVWPFMVDWMEKPKSLEFKTAAQHKEQTFKDKGPAISTNFNGTVHNKKKRMGSTLSNVESKQNSVGNTKPASRFRDNILKLLYKKTSNQKMGSYILPTLVERDANVDQLPIRSTDVTSSSSSIANSLARRLLREGVSSRAGSPLQGSSPPRARISPQVMSPSRAKSPPRATNPPLARGPPRVMSPSWPKTQPQTTSPPRARSPVKTEKLKLLTSPPPPTSPSKILIPLKKRQPQRIWGKAKWASDFIDNVINKIKCGIYYTSEPQTKKLNLKTPQNRTSDTGDLNNHAKEVSIQVTMPIITEDFTPKVTIQKKKELTVILPGFDDAVPPLEIKAMTRNLIAVKHCIMNVLLQFDVNVPSEADQSRLAIKHSTSCIPLSAPDSRTKVFKCKTGIPNAALPAELCSIIPRVMTQFLDKLTPPILPLQEPISNASLSIISEHATSNIQGPSIFSLLPEIRMSPELMRFRNGRFSKNLKSWTGMSNENISIISIKELPYQYHNKVEILSPQTSLYRQNIVVHPSRELALNSTKTQCISSNLPSLNSASKHNLCTDLVPYTGNKPWYGGCIVQNTPLIALKELFNKMLQVNTNSLSEYLPTIKMQTCNNHEYLNLTIGNHQDASLCIDITLFKYNPLSIVTTTVSSNAIVQYEHPEKQIEYIKLAEIKKSNRTESRKAVLNASMPKIKKKGHVGYVQLYKKCKSTSHIVAERRSTPLSKVRNMDEFFQAMGAGKLLSSVFDGSCEKKILAFVSHLKTYISGITPRQALLVMLLANKKDTSNLIRFRSVILQGIAVHRITRASELDMEVEVIENEKFNTMPEYLDVPPLLEIKEKNDNLLEELIWIAKTTASDYQRQFDGFSVKLLKTLLGKRKRLNPSYLRVLARYVGLGLLKTPVNHYSI